jgi:tetratricopeptide (TPR) repeat protein
LHARRPDDAQIYLDRILKNGDTAEARFLLGTRMFESGDYPAAVKQFANAVALNPNLPQLQSFYGQALLRTGDPDGAAQAFRNAPGTDFAASLGLAQIAVVRKQFDVALAPAKRAVSLRPQDGEPNLVLAEALAALHQYPAALPYAEAATTAMPRSADAHRTLASIYSNLHRPARAASENSLATRLTAELMASDRGPQIHDEAPDFTLPRPTSSATISLRDYRRKGPVVLVFGSYSCPNFRDSAESLKALQARYGARIPFLLVYIREAHAGADWQSTRNIRSGLQITTAADMSDKEGHAALCSRKLHLPFPAVVDRMDNAVESAYNAWPSRAFVVDSGGRIAFSTRLTEIDFHPDEMDRVLRALSTSAAAAQHQ